MDTYPRLAVVLAGCLAGLAGSYLYAGILNPLDTQWLLQQGDMLQHYLGWLYFRHENWSWPLGALHTFGTEVRSSIVFTDSLPLLAIPLKLLQTWLPDPFQYQGLASLANMVLNAMAACCILVRLKLPAAASIAFALVVALLPAVTFRGPGGAGHESLMAHWTFLFALCLMLFHDNLHPATLIKWAVLLAVTVLIHFYMFLLVGMLWGLWWLARTLEQRHTERASPNPLFWPYWLLYSLLQPLGILLIMWAVGYLNGSSASPAATGFGFYSAEPAAWFNGYSYLPGLTDISALFPAWSPDSAGRYEGMSYVGAGIMLLWLTALLLYARQPLRAERGYRYRVYASAALAIVLFIFALGDTVSLGHLFSFPLPLPWPEPLKAILRASGRMVWVLMYLLIFAAALVLARRLTPRKLVLAAFGVFALQLFDLRHWYHYIHEQSRQAASYRMMEDPRFAGWQGPELQRALQEHRALYISHADDIVGMLPLAWLAGQHHMAINVAYVARITAPVIDRAVTPARQALAAGKLDPQVVYAITEQETARRACSLGETQCIVTPLATFAWHLPAAAAP